MFNTYKDIFDKRGDMYHYAMTQYPEARNEEFTQLLKYVDLNDKDTIADIPSGGCYFKKYIQSKSIFYIDTSSTFLNNCKNKYNVIKSSVEDTPFKHNFFDKIFSLAGTHHLENKKTFFLETQRILKNKGNFIYADVCEGSQEDQFLNVFVDKYNSMGHKGIFLNDKTLSLLIDVDFNIESHEYIKIHWNFKNEIAMVDFIKNLFGLDLATDDEILDGLNKILGYSKSNHLIKLNWGLNYIHIKKL